MTLYIHFRSSEIIKHNILASCLLHIWADFSKMRTGNLGKKKILSEKSWLANLDADRMCHNSYTPRTTANLFHSIKSVKRFGVAHSVLLASGQTSGVRHLARAGTLLLVSTQNCWPWVSIRLLKSPGILSQWYKLQLGEARNKPAYFKVSNVWNI